MTKKYATFHEMPTADLVRNLVGGMLEVGGNLNEYAELVSIVVRELKNEVSPRSTSYPYLAVAQEFGMDYGLALQVAHSYDTGVADPDHPIPEMPNLPREHQFFEAVRAAWQREHARRQEVLK